MHSLTIPLSQGQHTLIDEADYSLVAPYRWHVQREGLHCYAAATTRREDGRKAILKMHRVILAAPPGSIVDHISGDTLDNRRQNLRFATRAQNNANRRMQRNNQSGYKGVIFMAGPGRRKRWHATIQSRSLGYYTTPEEAALAYDEAARALFGPYAWCNFDTDKIRVPTGLKPIEDTPYPQTDPVSIPLTQGQHALVDLDDYPLVAPYKWCAQHNGRRYIAVTEMRRPGGSRANVLMHRWLLDAPEDMQVDHISMDTLDNRRCNLRLATRGQNNANRPVQSNCRSGYKGVYTNASASRAKPWRACIRKDHVSRHLGSFATAEEAARAYDAAARALFGPFARCNFTDG